jgi:hypothetical protein
METIEQLLKQAEEQHKIIQLNAMFAKNMTFFQQAMPQIYAQFTDYMPTEIKLIITENGGIDLANTELNNQLVYGSDPIAFAETTVAGFIKNPLSQTLSPEETQVINAEREAHTPNINAIIHQANVKNKQVTKHPLGKRTEFIFMLGIGLGYQITELLKHTDIQHLIIAETNLDIFFAALHTFDWSQLNDKFQGKNTINLILGQTTEMFNHMVAHHVQQIGVYNAAKPYIFTHLCSTALTETTVSFLQNIPNIVGALGYFDDEKTGLTHTINNFRNKVPFLRSHGFLLKQFDEKPVFLIGNGPSLDIAKDFIAAHKDQAIIVSCGTALSSLFKLGIKPDFHVELERTYPIKEWIETTTTPEFRKDITLLAVNTVHPDLPKLFTRSGMALKHNDLGGTFIDKYILDSELSVTLGACNPTVANCGLSYCAALGFTNIYLFGIDLGFPEGAKHHSAHSFHYDIKDEDIDSFNLANPENTSDFRLSGNFGGTVISNQLFLRSKLSLELILKDCKEINCYNTSNGVSIEKTTPIKLEEIDTSSWTIFDKKSYRNKIFTKYFSNKNLLSPPGEKEIIKTFMPTIKILEELYKIFEADITSFEEAIDLLAQNDSIMQDFSRNKDTKELSRLLKGSSDSFSLMLALNLNGKDNINAFNQAKEYYRKYLQSAQHAIKSNLLENDCKAFNIKEKLK